ncbi:DUF2857 domain-containing protein [Actinobacillus pleuropneumoniae]|uniref:DUF2857 domain-containing protein n=1 Tax=Actinobacillus pleuropneumoniae TaxID=715 RepID=UPI003B02D5DC
MINTTLNHAVISEILAHSRRGEIHYLFQLGFAEEEIAEIENLSTLEICDICESTISFSSIQINHNAFWNLVTAAREKTRQRNIIDRALNLGASSEILHKRFGQSSADVSARRKLLGITEPMGRKRNATEEEEKLVWELWIKQRDSISDNIDLENSDEGLDLMMFISEESGVCLTEVSRLILQWVKETKPSAK